MPVLVPNTPPPPDYYADNLLRLVGYVAHQYNDLLSAPEREVLERIRGLSKPTLRLFARLLSRRGPVLRIDRLVYDEVPDVGACLAELGSAGLVLVDHDVPADSLLDGQTLNEIAQVFPLVRASVRPPKAALIELIVARYPDHEIRRRLKTLSPWIETRHRPTIGIFCVLFFGDTDRDLTTFVLEDLGVWTFEAYPLDPAARLFHTRGQLESFVALVHTRSMLDALEQRWDAALVETILERLWEGHEHRLIERRRHRQLIRLGMLAERARDYESALACYGTARNAPARERCARVLARLGDLDGVRGVLDTIRAAPASRAELDFALRFAPARARLKPRLERKPVDCLRLAAPPAHRVESAALDKLLERGGVGAHLENQFPLAFFGLVFWDVVFAPVPGVFPNAYQLGPIDLFWPDFSSTRAESIAARLDELNGAGAFSSRVLSTFDRKFGIHNALVNWGALHRPLVERAIEVVPPGSWIPLFRYVANNLREARTGFPDLVLFYDDASFEFVEVKGPGDHLRAEQRTWLGVLEEAALPARVLKVAW